MLRFIDGCNKCRKNISKENVGWVVGCVARFRNGCNIFRKNVSKGKCRVGGGV